MRLIQQQQSTVGRQRLKGRARKGRKFFWWGVGSLLKCKEMSYFKSLVFYHVLG